MGNLRQSLQKYTKITYNEKTGLYKGHCSFCLGDTETFMVDTDQDLYVCYGCGEMGNKEKFLQKKEGVKIKIPDAAMPEILPLYKKSQQYYAFILNQDGNPAPKYINSADSPLFSKRKILYGYPYRVPEGVKRANAIVICEGYMDLIAMKRIGLNDSAAVLGTALTEDHAKRIATDYKTVFLALDSDEAGTSAMLSSINILREFGLNVFIMKYNTPEHLAKDADKLITKYGRDAFLSVLKRQTKADFFLARHAGDIKRLTDLLVKLDREGFEPKRA